MKKKEVWPGRECLQKFWDSFPPLLRGITPTDAIVDVVEESVRLSDRCRIQLQKVIATCRTVSRSAYEIGAAEIDDDALNDLGADIARPYYLSAMIKTRSRSILAHKGDHLENEITMEFIHLNSCLKNFYMHWQYSLRTLYALRRTVYHCLVNKSEKKSAAAKSMGIDMIYKVGRCLKERQHISNRARDEPQVTLISKAIRLVSELALSCEILEQLATQFLRIRVGYRRLPEIYAILTGYEQGVLAVCKDVMEAMEYLESVGLG